MTEIRITVFVCAGETDTASAQQVFAYADLLFKAISDSSSCHNPDISVFQSFDGDIPVSWSELLPIQLFKIKINAVDVKDIHYQH